MADLALSDVRLRLGEREILKGVTLGVPDRTVVALLGPAASGKTALMGAVAGLTQPHAGTIRIGDRTVFDGAKGVDDPPHRRRVGLVSQSDAFWPQRTVFENVAFFAGLARKRDAKTRAEQALELVGVRDLADRLPPQLTASERRQVTLARALVREPAVMLLDDPLSHLDGPPRAEARIWLRQLLIGLNLPVLVATRDPVEAMALADRVVVLNDGFVEQEGAAADVYSEPETVFSTEYMAQSNRLRGTLVENAGTRAMLDVMGSRLAGITQTRAPLGTQAVGLIRVERTRIGGGPGANRLPMTLATQMYVGERWEVVFVREALTIRAYTSAPLRHESYHVEFPPDALWVF
jgi:iron(III) transport system ATP-binding protein